MGMGENTRRIPEQRELGTQWDEDGFVGTWKGNSNVWDILFTLPENFASLLAQEGKRRSRNCLDVEGSNLSRELIERRILSTETKSVGITNAAELEERHGETLGK